MHGSRGGQGVQIISPFQDRNQPAAAVLFRDGDELFRDPGEVGRLHAQLRQRIGDMGIEAG